MASPAAKNGRGSDTSARSQTMRAGIIGTSQITRRWIAYKAQAVEYAITCGAPAPLLSAAAPMEKPTTGPPGVSAPPSVAITIPNRPDSGPNQGAIHAFGSASATNPEIGRAHV